MRIGPESLQELRALLAKGLEGSASLETIVLATGDGRCVGMAGRKTTGQARVAALSATLLSMATAATKELGGSRTSDCVLLYDNGMACFLRLGNEGRFVLCVAASLDITLGMLLSQARKLGTELTSALSRLS